ncbi:MAG TPA: hypothetical protein PLE43_08010 [Alphaproteobacteria bacterium]|nr:hypothetical protein [Alphaproteobacteria bacterium]
MHKSQTLFFTITIFLSAYLLFVVQPMIGKAMLPVLGGTPSVWNTTMLFFQILLLGGYFYAHAISKIKSLKIQFLSHFGFVLLAGLSTLPMMTTMPPPADLDNPMWWQIKNMMVLIGLPFLFLSATAPLLQKWFSHTSHPDAHNPYFLYASSNLGSVLALLLYPVLIEQFLPLAEQSLYWAIGYAVLTVLMLACTFTVLKRISIESSDTQQTEDADLAPTWKTICLWMFLAFIPSSLMLGYTSFITSDIGSAPMFWVAPLTLYILSFVIAFAKKPLIPLKATRVVFAILFAVIYSMMGCSFFLKLELGIALGILFFVTAIMCHQELVRLKPPPKHLTLFYLIMSFGGALGGLFNALLAPVIFLKPYEFLITGALSLFCWNLSSSLSFKSIASHKKPMMILTLICLLALSSFMVLRHMVGTPYVFALPFLGFAAIPLVLILMDRKPYFIVACFVLSIATPFIPWQGLGKTVDISRNYFGTLITTDNPLTRNLAHGTTLHGSQPLNPADKTIPLTYYNSKTSIGESFEIVKKYHPSPLEVAGLGLGTGSVACLLRPQDHIQFFEIDPDIIRIASNPNIFSYLHDCPPQSDITQGDARLKVKNITDASYDLLLVDVFSSDSIPLHLITKQATEMYLSKIKSDGMVVFHVTSRYFELEPELALISQSLEIPAITKISSTGEVEGTDYQYFDTIAVILTRNETYLRELKSKGWLDVLANADQKPWSDDFANPLRAMSFNILEKRSAQKEAQARAIEKTGSTSSP